MHRGRTGEIIAASDFKQREGWDVIMGKFLLDFSTQQYEKI